MNETRPGREAETSVRAIISGGSQGLGWAVAQRILSDGGQVWIWDRNPPSSALPERVWHTSVDVSRLEDVTAAMENPPWQSAPTVLVNSAGIAGDRETLWEHSVDRWHHVIDVNLNGTYHCLRAVVPSMVAAGYGRILNVASIAGKEGNPLASAYSASKAGVLGLTKSLAKELVTTGVTVNAIAPAAFETPIVMDHPNRAEFLLSKIPMGRLGRPEEFAAMASWILSKENSFTTGAVFDISGGRATY